MGRPLGAALGARRLSLLEEHSLKTSTPTRLTGDDGDGDYDEYGDSDDELPQSSHWEETPVLRPPFLIKLSYFKIMYTYIDRHVLFTPGTTTKFTLGRSNPPPQYHGIAR